MSADHSDSSSIHSQPTTINFSHTEMTKSSQRSDMDEFFTPDVVDVLCYSDSTEMRSSLLETIVNQKKQELMKNPEVCEWITKKEKEKIQQERVEESDKEVSYNMMETNNTNPDRSKALKDAAQKVIKSSNESKNLPQTQITSHIPVHPSVYTMNRQTGVGKTQAKATKQ